MKIPSFPVDVFALASLAGGTRPHAYLRVASRCLTPQNSEEAVLSQLEAFGDIDGDEVNFSLKQT